MNQYEFNEFFRKLNELVEKDQRGEQIELDEQIDFLLMAGTTNHENRKNNLKKLLGD